MTADISLQNWFYVAPYMRVIKYFLPCHQQAACASLIMPSQHVAKASLLRKKSVQHQKNQRATYSAHTHNDQPPSKSIISVKTILRYWKIHSV